MRTFLPLSVIAAALSASTAFAGGPFDVFTDFEFEDTDGFFELGNAPTTVQFLNGQAKTIGAPLLYTSGMNAWMIDAGQTGEILFQTQASGVDFWFRDQAPETASVLTFFGADDQVLAQFNGSFTAFQHIVVENVGPIARITLQNNGPFAYTVIDDFGFTAVPAPGGMALFALSAGVAFRRRRTGK